MPWDDELEALVIYARDTFGEQACLDAIARAVASLTGSEPRAFLEGEADLVDDLKRGAIFVEDDDGRPWSMDALYESLRLELERMVS